jgi:hypothetical protein
MPIEYTADDHEIVDGLHVWTNDLKRGYIHLGYAVREMPDRWYTIQHDDGTQSLMNAKRLRVVHPFTREVA